MSSFIPCLPFNSGDLQSRFDNSWSWYEQPGMLIVEVQCFVFLLGDVALWRSPACTYTRRCSCFECVGEWAEISKPRPKQCPHVIITSHNRPGLPDSSACNIERPGYEAIHHYLISHFYLTCDCSSVVYSHNIIITPYHNY